jgi:hypothetical protein
VASSSYLPSLPATAIPARQRQNHIWLLARLPKTTYVSDTQIQSCDEGYTRPPRLVDSQGVPRTWVEKTVEALGRSHVYYNANLVADEETAYVMAFL